MTWLSQLDSKGRQDMLDGFSKAFPIEDFSEFNRIVIQHPGEHLETFDSRCPSMEGSTGFTLNVATIETKHHGGI